MNGKFGYEEGETCGRNGCTGIIRLFEVENCSCHINPPCGECTTPREYCPECDYQAKNDRVVNDFVVNEIPGVAEWKFWEPRKLDNTKIDYRTIPHTHFSMILEGVYPESMSPEDARKEIEKKGTFGGRFEQFGGGKFRFIAYTD